MKIFGIAGHSGMGKTTLPERLVPEIAARALRVSFADAVHNASQWHAGIVADRLSGAA